MQTFFVIMCIVEISKLEYFKQRNVDERYWNAIPSIDGAHPAADGDANRKIRRLTE